MEYVSALSPVHRMHRDGRAFEDGTLNFLGIAAVTSGLDFLEEVGIDEIHAHVARHTARLLEILRRHRHDDGGPLTTIYGPPTTERRGGTVAFNLWDARGRVVPSGAVERAASERGICLRGGRFCNPGAAEAALDVPADAALRCFEEAEGTFTLRELAECLGDGAPVAAIRASVGIATNDADLDRLDAFLGEMAGRLASGAAMVGADATD